MEAKTMDIPLDAEVKCVDGNCGRSTYVILNPATKEMTHIVVQEKELLPIERLVPISMIEDSTPERIQLKCTKDQLGEMERFIETHFIPADPSYLGDWYDAYARYGPGGMYGGYMVWPYAVPADGQVPVEEEKVPAGELALRRGAHVHATDGQVGRVDEFLIDPEKGHVTHLVLREGHLWGQKDVTIPVSHIKRIEADDVYLTIDKSRIESLPEIPIHRWWR
jgi:sporulation protein YlmC with PRC-barrel domain